jgi:guanine deaminase
MTDANFLQRAIDLATIHSVNGRHGPFGAVVVKDGDIIAEGWNQVVAFHDPTAHAEIIAIRAACRQLETHHLNGCTIYASCEPCPMCLSAIYWARIDTVVFAASHKDAARAGFDDSFLYKEMAISWVERKIKSHQGLEREGRVVFEKWIENPAKVNY